MVSSFTEHADVQKEGASPSASYPNLSTLLSAVASA